MATKRRTAAEKRRRRRTLRGRMLWGAAAAIVLALAGLGVGCEIEPPSSEDSTEEPGGLELPTVEASYQVGPIRFSIDTYGTWSVSVGSQWATPIGTFGIGLVEEEDLTPDRRTVVIRDRRRPANEIDQVWEVPRDLHLIAIVDNGRTVIADSADLLVIDTSRSELISFMLTPDGYEEGVIGRAAETWLSYELPAEALAEWVGQVQGNGPWALAYMLQRSDVVSEPVSDAEREAFVRDLYYVFAYRTEDDNAAPDREGIAFWVDRLRSGERHTDVAIRFAHEVG